MRKYPFKWLNSFNDTSMKSSLWADFGSWKLVNELFCRRRTSSFVLFANSQVGKVPEIVLSERSMWLKSFWYRRKWGTFTKLQDGREIWLSWNFGLQKLPDSTLNELDLELSLNNLNSERLASESSGKEPSKLLSNNDYQTMTSTWGIQVYREQMAHSHLIGLMRDQELEVQST